MNDHPPADDSLNDLVGAIYDCVIDPSRWHGTIDRIRRRYGFYNSVLGVNGPQTNEVILDIAINIPREMVPVMNSNGEEVIRLWGGWSRILSVPLEEPIRQSDVRPPDWADGAYHETFLAPQGIVDSVAIVLVRDLRTVANLSFGMRADVAPVADTVMDELRILAPHLRRAVVIGRLLETSTAAAASFAEALDAAAAGVVLVDAARRVVHTNRTAAAMLAAGDPVRVTGGQLELSIELIAGAFGRAIAAAGEVGSGGKGTGVPARRLNGDPLTVQVMPLERRSGAGTPASAVAAVFIADATGGPPTPPDILAVMFDLTPAESRVFTLAVEGGELAAIGEQLSITPATVKTHLARIYQKTGRNSRAGLVQLAHEIAPPG
jgi:DNA-binding CsgD family transcriptional regulator